MSKGFNDTLVQENQLYTEAVFLHGEKKSITQINNNFNNLSLDHKIAVADLFYLEDALPLSD